MADTANHTPGPWAFKTAGNGDCGISASRTGYFAEAFADIRYAGEDARAEALANARLIAAAPDILEAAKAIFEPLDAWDGMSECPITTAHIDVLRTAISKAEGK